ncbi:MAG: response regulator [Deltaproteobacteria bacterium]|nr:response regulator [Deltaproteobacteria bacterium]
MTDPCVLVVEDDTDLRETLAELLAMSGYRVETAEHGRAALDNMQTKKPCLVLLDLMMPVMDGWQVIEAMKHDPELKDIPVCVVSAQAQSAPPGSKCVIKKPTALSALLGVVAEHCLLHHPP